MRRMMKRWSGGKGNWKNTNQDRIVKIIKLNKNQDKNRGIYLVFKSSLTNTVTIPNLLIYGWISVLFASIHNILDVSH